ncbi:MULTISPECIES: metal-sensitive transcriptional regulator [unclassified Exiguobacterium]|uniref:metal-sensitive transcriptional regulator n=1 Tax=unclassified Exiguobacterium TaxID=2644629 RepID=UPI001BE75C3D|nr:MULTISPECIES: metal-sensitive transcriptional regulator [unclassified Exiguobacterium]
MEQYQYDPKVLNRMKRVEGQIRAIIRMMEEGKECRDVVTQLSAARSALDRASTIIVAKNLEQCIITAQAGGEDTSETVEEAIKMLMKR